MSRSDVVEHRHVAAHVCVCVFARVYVCVCACDSNY